MYVEMHGGKFKKMERVFSSKKQYLLKDGEIIADKDTQIKSEIDNYIGLSMDDFTRSVVLPQGKFSEFLKLSGTDRRDMLERLFGLQKYGKQMLDKIRKKLAIYQDNISAIDNQILGKGNFSEDELEKNKEILNNLKSEKIQVENFLKTKTDEFKIKENFWNLQKELETLKIEEKRILENKETVKDYKSKIELDIKAKEINAVYENYNSLTKKVEEKEKLSINIKNDSKIIENRLKEEKNNLEILKNSIASFEKEKDSNAVTVIERAKSQEFLNKKNEYLEKKSQESEIIRNISNANSSIEKINSILKNLETEIEENKSNLGLLVEINESHIMSKEIQIERLETKKIKDLEIKISNLKEKLDLKILEKNNLEKEILLLENNQDLLKEKQYDVVGIGKISDIFAQQGLTKSFSTKSNSEGMAVLKNLTTQTNIKGLIMANLVEFDSLYGHRNDVEGYAKALELFDKELGSLLLMLKADDLLIITADHGCDPTTASTDHSREYVPLLLYNEHLQGKNLGTRKTFADVAATIATNFNLNKMKYGENLL